MNQLNNLTESLAPFVKEGAKIVIWFFIIASLIVFSMHSLLSITHPYPLDYGEAPLINQAMQLVSGDNIYRSDIDTPPFTIANYPPLYVLALSPFIKTGGNMFQIGRVISLLATLASAIFLGLLTNHFTKNKIASFATVALFLSFPYVVEWSARARIDCLALAFATAALYVLARWPESRWAFFVGGLLLVAAAYTRQSYALAAPLAAFTWMWSQKKIRAIQLVLLVGGVGGLLFLLLNALTGGGFFYNIITANVNEFGWDRLQNNLWRLWENAGIILIIGVFFLTIGWKYFRGWSLIAFFLVGAFLSSLTIGKIGSNINYFLELTAALALVGGSILDQTQKHAWRYALIILLVCFQIGILMNSTMGYQVDGILASRRGDFNALQYLEQIVLDLEGPVPADEYMGMLTLHDRPLYIQPFEVSQMAKDGVWDQQPFLNDIGAQKFKGILIHHFGTWPAHKQRWTPEMLSAIDNEYRPTMTMAGTVVFVPQPETVITKISPPRQYTGSTLETPEIGDLLEVSDMSYWGQADIAINPSQPDHIAIIATQTSQFDCRLPNCKVDLYLHISKDGGVSWTRTRPFTSPDSIFYNGQVDFDQMNNLYAFGIRNNTLTLNLSNLEQDYTMGKSNVQDITRAQVIAKPWFRVHPDTGQVFISLDAQEMDMLFTTPSLIRSTDYYNRWTVISRADLRVSVNDFNSGKANWLEDIQVLFGEEDNVSLVWTWDWEPWIWPRTVWMANSMDGGETFGEPSPILETWGPIKATSSNGTFAIAYRIGTEVVQKIAVAVTSDNGKTWESTIASGDLQLPFDADHGPGIAISPDGIIDLVFIAHEPENHDCVLDIQKWQESLRLGQVDPCSYNVYYTFSKDKGRRFSAPIQINQSLILGESLARFEGRSTYGSHLEIAATDEYAYPVWIGTPQEGMTQVYTVKIKR